MGNIKGDRGEYEAINYSKGSINITLGKNVERTHKNWSYSGIKVYGLWD